MQTKESVEDAVDPADPAVMRSKVKREIGRISLVKAFTRNLTASQDSLGSSDADSERSPDNDYASSDEDEDGSSDSALVSALRHWVS